MIRLKDRTLKNVYEQRTPREGVSQLTEAGLDPAKMKQYEDALAKLKNLVPPNADLFNMAIDKATNELHNYIQGGLKQGIKNVFGLGGDPVAKAVNLANGIRAGLANIPTLAKGFVPAGMEQENQKSMLELVPAEKQEQLIAIMTKAFGKLPYVMNVKAAAQELLQNTNPQMLFKNAQQIAATPQIAPPAPPAQTAQPATAGQAAPTPAASGAPTTGTTATAPTQAAAATKGAIAPTPSQVAPPTANKRLDATTDAAKISDIAYFIASQSGVDKDAANKVIQALAKAKGLMDIQVPAKPSNKLGPGNVPPAAAPVS